MPNQWKPTPRLNDKQIVEELQKHFDTARYGLGLTKYLEIRNNMGLKRTRQQRHTIETIRDAMAELRSMYPNAGAREMVNLLFHERNMSVSRNVVTTYFAVYEPDLVRLRRAGCLRRRRFWAAGVNDLFAVDQHDKWLRFGLGLHTGIEPFSGRIMWMRVWHSNRNPQLILSYYLDTIEEFGHMPLVTQSDPGSENFGIANAHTMLRQWHDPALVGSLQHRWMRSKKNVMPEIAWSQLRRRFTPGFENLLDLGVNSGWYDTNNTLQVMVFRWVFIPWLQQELDAYRCRVNNTAKRRDRNKILPHGVPNLVYQSAEDFGALDFKIMVEREALDHVRSLYIKPSHVVFDLVPEPLGECINRCYLNLGSPVVTRQSVWDVYLRLLDALQTPSVDLPPITLLQEDEEEDIVPLLDNQEDLPFREESSGEYYMGGVGRGLGLRDEPNISLGVDENLVGLDHAGLVIWEFSDEEGGDSELEDEW
ncbi:hypothetical protein BU15DRAFT_90769 [Melanogaster broomeanus]|nr:hypothetical protein BU15DRAFT_90769 [Melanogaster broomeanus]